MAVNSFIFENMVCQFPIGEWPSPKDLTIFHFVELIAKENCMGRSVKSFNNIITRIKNMTRPKNNDSVVNMIYKESLRALLVDIKTRKIRGYLEGSNESDKTKKSEPVNRLTGEGERSSQVTDRLVLKGRFDVSSLLMEAREELVKLEEQRQGTLLSSPDIL
ncbi:hypothetical protein BX616_008744 [Lobosporangium transversale]|nr:hypothetical protein BX616_008744 [Lobosporangium transversale]